MPDPISVPDRPPTPEPELPNPDMSLFAPITLEDVKQRLQRIEETPCYCNDRPHDNAIHDLAEDDVPVLIAEIERLRALVAAVTETCKHCNGPIHRNEKTTTLDWTHSDGDQAGRFTCPVEPYGFHAEPVGAECGNHPANRCNGARGLAVLPWTVIQDAAEAVGDA